MMPDERTFIETFMAVNRRERWLTKGLAHLQYTYDIQFHLDMKKCIVLSGCKWQVLASWLLTLDCLGAGRVMFGDPLPDNFVAKLSDIRCVQQICAFEGLLVFRSGRAGLVCSENGVDWLLLIDNAKEREQLRTAFERHKTTMK